MRWETSCHLPLGALVGVRKWWCEACQKKKIPFHTDGNSQETSSKIRLTMVSAASIAQGRRDRLLQRRQFQEDGSCLCSLQKDDVIGCWGAAALSVTSGSVLCYGAVLSRNSGLIDTAWIKGNQHEIKALENGTVVKFAESPSKWNLASTIAPIFKNIFPDRSPAFEIIDPTLDGDSSYELTAPLESWESYAVSSKANGVVVLGPKSSGKSSFARYLVNHHTSKYGPNSTVYMELDPGQPELGPPGTISLSWIGAPLVGSAFTWASFSNHSVIKSHFLGYTSAKDQPELYIQLVMDLLASYRAIGKASLLVINTSGWIKGLGLDLTYRILDILGQEIEPVFLGSLESINDDFQWARQVDSLPFVGDQPKAQRLNAQDSRTLQMMSYFKEPKRHRWQHLTEMTPLSAPISSIAGIALWAREDVTYQQIETFLPATIVALLNVTDEALPLVKTEDGLVDETLINPEFANCVSLAVVQSVEFDGTEPVALRLILPSSLDLSTIKPSNIVVCRGRIQLSIYELWNAKLADVDMPYLSEETYGVGSQQWRTRRNIQRRAYSTTD